MGQKPVKADCSRLAPTKAVNQSQVAVVLRQDDGEEDEGAGHGEHDAVDGHGG